MNEILQQGKNRSAFLPMATHPYPVSNKYVYVRQAGRELYSFLRYFNIQISNCLGRQCSPRVLTLPYSSYRRREGRQSSFLRSEIPPSFPLGQASDIVNPYQLYDQQRPCADVNYPYKLNADLTQRSPTSISTLRVLHPQFESSAIHERAKSNKFMSPI